MTGHQERSRSAQTGIVKGKINDEGNRKGNQGAWGFGGQLIEKTPTLYPVQFVRKKQSAGWRLLPSPNFWTLS